MVKNVDDPNSFTSGYGSEQVAVKPMSIRALVKVAYDNDGACRVPYTVIFSLKTYRLPDRESLFFAFAGLPDVDDAVHLRIHEDSHGVHGFDVPVSIYCKRQNDLDACNLSRLLQR